ncbi:MAG: hypothetical protein K2X47_03780 [Bdellovibrionales bacterium]|nr:hypothetical protein [Bdellovibrionales bacterium]
MKNSFKVLLLFSYFVAVLMATQEFSSTHHESQLTQETIVASHGSEQAPALDMDHNQDTHSSAADCNDCCVAGCSHHPAMIVSVSSGFVLDRSIDCSSSQDNYKSPVLSALKRPPIA